MMVGMRAAFLLTCFACLGTSLELRLKGRLVSGRPASHEHLHSGGACSSTGVIKADATCHARHIIFGEACVRTGGTGQQTVETGLNAVLDALWQSFGMASQNL